MLNEPSQIAREALATIIADLGVAERTTHQMNRAEASLASAIDRALTAQAEQIAAKDAEVERLRFDVSERVTPAHVQQISDLRTQITAKDAEVERLRSWSEVNDRYNSAHDFLDQLGVIKGNSADGFPIGATVRDRINLLVTDFRTQLAEARKWKEEDPRMLREIEQLRTVLLACRDTVGIYISCAGHHLDGDDPCPRCQIASEIDGALAFHQTSKEKE